MPAGSASTPASNSTPRRSAHEGADLGGAARRPAALRAHGGGEGRGVDAPREPRVEQGRAGPGVVGDGDRDGAGGAAGGARAALAEPLQENVAAERDADRQK